MRIAILGGYRNTGAWIAALAGLASLSCADPALAQGKPDGCLQPGAAVRLDHVTIGVADLERATAAFAALGFELKPGRPHPNGIRNVHAKFEDGTEIELLTVRDPTDELTRWYGDFIAAGGGGAFLALEAGPVERVADLLRARGLDPRVQNTGPIRYASFPPGHDLRHVYFIEYGTAPDDPPDIFRHPNGSLALTEVWVEVWADTSLPSALLALGARECGALRHPAGFAGEAFALANGRVVLVERVGESAFSRVLAVTVRRGGAGSDRLIGDEEAEGVWIRLVSAEGARKSARSRSPAPISARRTSRARPPEARDSAAGERAAGREGSRRP